MNSHKTASLIIAVLLVALFSYYFWVSLTGSQQSTSNNPQDSGAPYSILSYSPENSTVLRGGVLEISFLLNDTSIKNSEVQLFVNGSPVAFYSAVEANGKRIYWRSAFVDGLQNCTLIITSQNHTIFQKSVIFWVDNTAPTISSVSPCNTSVDGPNVRISAYIDDNIKIDQRTLTLKVDSFTVNNYVFASGRLYYDARLSDGNHTVTVSVKDSAGNLAERTWTFCVGAQPSSNDVVIIAKTGYIGEAGLPVIVGEIKNNGNYTVSNVLINGSFLCSEGNVINNDKPVPAVILNYAELPILPPGEISPFKIVMPSTFPDFDYIIKNLRKFNASIVNYTQTNSSPSATIEISSYGSLNSSGYYCLDIVAKNNGAQEALNVKIVATFYASSSVIDVESCSIGSLKPGESVTLKIPVPDKLVSGKITSYSLRVSA